MGGINCTVRDGVRSWAHYNGRGDVASRSAASGSLTYAAAYEAFGTRTQQHGTNADRHRANTKEEDPTGLLNEGMRYRCLATGTFITRDQASFVEGPNVYTYVNQNPWAYFDPHGLRRTGSRFSGTSRRRDRGDSNQDSTSARSTRNVTPQLYRVTVDFDSD